MKKLSFFAVCATVCMLATSCSNSKEETPAPAPEPVQEAPYEPQHVTDTIAVKNLKTYNYLAAPAGVPAQSVSVDYGTPGRKPVGIRFSYPNGDTRTVVLPAGFKLWSNQAGQPRVVSDKFCTVWVQGTVNGRFCEVVVFGDPSLNEKRIKPDSYKGTITYRERSKRK